MAQIITIKLIKASPRVGPFTLTDQMGNIIASDVPKSTLIVGASYTVDDDVTLVTIQSTGKCNLTKTISVGVVTISQLVNAIFTEISTACMWRHLVNINLYNNYYGITEPYIIEYPFAYQYQDQILQNVKDYTKAYKYIITGTGMFSYNDKTEVNDYFNKSIVYNGQQSSGILNLVQKPRNNMKEYLRYPIYGTEGKQIIVTKSDNFYNYNTFWNVLKDKAQPLFITSCESLSIDKQVNQPNMDYGVRSFTKEQIRAKDLKVRHILDDRSDSHLVSQFIVTPSQISYK